MTIRLRQTRKRLYRPVLKKRLLEALDKIGGKTLLTEEEIFAMYAQYRKFNEVMKYAQAPYVAVSPYTISPTIVETGGATANISAVPNIIFSGSFTTTANGTFGASVMPTSQFGV